jgi:hypothetical protein
MTTLISLPKQFLCHICGKNHDYGDRSRLIAHIKKTERLHWVNAKNLDEWNVSREEVEANITKMNSSGSENDEEEDKKTEIVSIEPEEIDMDERFPPTEDELAEAADFWDWPWDNEKFKVPK